jgi:hypothetical protein
MKKKPYLLSDFEDAERIFGAVSEVVKNRSVFVENSGPKMEIIIATKEFDRKNLVEDEPYYDLFEQACNAMIEDINKTVIKLAKEKMENEKEAAIKLAEAFVAKHKKESEA